MLRKCLVLGFCLLLSVAANAMNSETFTRALVNYKNCLDKTAICAKECKKTGNYEAYEKAMERSDQAADILIRIINKISSKTEADVAKYLIEKFRKEDDSNKKAARLAKKMLQVKTNYMNMEAMEQSRSSMRQMTYLEAIKAEMEKEK